MKLTGIKGIDYEISPDSPRADNGGELVFAGAGQRWAGVGVGVLSRALRVQRPTSFRHMVMGWGSYTKQLKLRGSLLIRM